MLLNTIRSGIIATSPDTDFYLSAQYRSTFYDKYKEWLPDSFNGFLIDANALGGSSGSLVVNKPRFLRATDKGQVKVYGDRNGQIFVLGILTESYFDLDSRITGTQRANIGGVISAGQTKKTIDLFK